MSFKKDLNKMKSLSDCIRPVSQLFLVIAGFTPILVLLKPSLFEFVVFVIADSIAFGVVKSLDLKLYTRLYPGAEILFKEKVSAFKEFNFSQKNSFLSEAFLFPKRRAAYISLVSIFKLIPAFLVATLFWKYESSFFEQAMKVVGTFGITMVYFFSMTFIEAHEFTSRLLNNVHEKFDWSKVFREYNLPKVKIDFEIVLSLAIGAMAIWMISLQSFIVFSYEDTLGGEKGPLVLRVLSIAVSAIVLTFHILYMMRSFLMKGWKRLFEQFDEVGVTRELPALSFHSAEVLAKFEKTFNLITFKLSKSEKELSLWAARQAEKSRYETIGEVSALIAHDLSNPLHVSRFCIEELKETPDKVHDPKYLGYLSENVERAIELTEAIRAKLKNPKGDEFKTTAFIEAHQYVLRLLKTQIYGFSKIQIQLDSQLQNLELNISRVDLIHILDNLYRNCIEHLLMEEIEEPKLEVYIDGWKNDSNKTLVNLSIRDNGLGLDKEVFDNLTTFEVSGVDKNARDQQMSMGLKLTRRLAEMNQGALDIDDEPKFNFKGTTFQLNLPVNQEGINYDH